MEKCVIGKENHDGTQFYLYLVEYFLLMLSILFSYCNYCYEQWGKRALDLVIKAAEFHIKKCFKRGSGLQMSTVCV